MNFSYSFSAVKGIQAGQDYYISMVPLKYLTKLFPNEDEIIPPEYRAQRRINEARIPEMKRYILDNRDSYVFSALSASINGKFKFNSYLNSEIGILEVSMDSIFLMNDGQHRKAAIELAMKEDPSLEEETISIVFFNDQGLLRSQQMFTDLNKHAVKTSNSLATLYDSRDKVAVATRKVIDKILFFKKFTDKERDILGKNSSNIFTLNMLYKANQKIINNENILENDLEFLIRYWELVYENMIEWQEVFNKELTKKSLRENYIVGLAITITSLGRLGRYFYENKEIRMQEYLIKLRNIDWLRSNLLWRGRTIGINGKILNSEEAVILTCSAIKKEIGVLLNKEEEQKEKQLTRRK